MAATNDYAALAVPPGGTARNAAAITPNDGADLTSVTLWIYVGVTGDVTLDTAGGQTTILYKAVPAGTQLRVAASRVRATGTTATNLVANW